MPDTARPPSPSDPEAGSETGQPKRSGTDPVLGNFRRIVPINAAVTLIVASATAFLLLPALPPSWVGIWWLLHAVPTVSTLVGWYLRSPPSGEARPSGRRRTRLFDILGAAFSGLTWGAGALFLPHLGQAHQMLMIVVAAGMVAGSAATLAVIPRAATVYMLCVATPYVVFLLAQDSAVGIALGLLSSVFTGAMLITNHIVNGVIRRNKRLLDENTSLYERIRAARAELLDIAESSEAFAFSDAKGRLQLWNRRFPDLLGINDGDLRRGDDLASLLAIAGLPTELLKAETTAPGGTLALPNGRFVRARIRKTLQGDRALIVIDFTEQQELLRAAGAARDAALAASQAKTIFLANMSHELRTPLNAIIGFSDVVQQRMFGDDSAKYDEYLRDINASARHLLEVINEILDLARIEANQIVLNESDVFLDEEIATCARLAASQFNRGSSAVAISAAPSLPPLIADARLVRQVLLNLMANGFKFSPAGTPIEAGARLNAANEIELWVRDHGIGIPKADQARIFEPFEQADTQLSRNYGGVGLGLSLVRAFVAAHQGRLSLDSAPGEGTKITATFPAARTGATADAEPSG